MTVPSWLFEVNVNAVEIGQCLGDINLVTRRIGWILSIIELLGVATALIRNIGL